MSASVAMSNVSGENVREENRMLQHELNRVEDLLAASRAERDEIGIKYNALSERVSSFPVDYNKLHGSELLLC